MEEQPVAGPQIMGLASGGEGDPPIETINRDRALDLVTGQLMVLADHHPDGLERLVLHKRKCLGFGERRALGPEIEGHTRIGVLGWVTSRHV